MKNFTPIIIPNLLVLSIILSSCHNMRNDDRNAVINLAGKEIVLPDSLGVMIQDIPVEYDFSFADYKIVTYIDSKGCTTCSMKLTPWNDLINEFKTIEGVDVNFLMILNKDAEDEIVSILKRNFFRHPVSFDPEGSLRLCLSHNVFRDDKSWRHSRSDDEFPCGFNPGIFFKVY